MKKTVVLFAEGFEEVEALTVVDFLRRAGVNVTMASVTGELEVVGSHDIQIKTDKLLNDIMDESTDAVVVPGGLPGCTNLRDSKEVIEYLQSQHGKGSLITAICAGPIVLEEADLLAGKNITSYPGFDDKLSGNYKNERVVIDEPLITARGPAVATDFALALTKALVGEKALEDLKTSILYKIHE